MAKDTKGAIRRRRILDRRTDNTMAKDTKGAIRRRRILDLRTDNTMAKGQNDKQWFPKKLYRKLQFEEHEPTKTWS
jgi:hypothetical protein